jgi:hypothetical protein
MIYHPQESKVTKIIKILAFWISILGMLWLCILIFHDDIKIPQNEVKLNISIKNKVNICLPEDEK